eukprot:XP_028353160.1 collagen alpha-1(XIV) chain-like [Physeter catodon]
MNKREKWLLSCKASEIAQETLAVLQHRRQAWETLGGGQTVALPWDLGMRSPRVPPGPHLLPGVSPPRLPPGLLSQSLLKLSGQQAAGRGRGPPDGTDGGVGGPGAQGRLVFELGVQCCDAHSPAVETGHQLRRGVGPGFLPSCRLGGRLHCPCQDTLRRRRGERPGTERERPALRSVVLRAAPQDSTRRELHVAVCCLRAPSNSSAQTSLRVRCRSPYQQCYGKPESPRVPPSRLQQSCPWAPVFSPGPGQPDPCTTPAERALRPEGFPAVDGETGLCALEGDEVMSQW